MFYYNALYDSTSFNIKAAPIWNLSLADISVVWDHIVNYWSSRYFAHSSFHLLFIILLFQIIFFKKSNYKLSMILLILFFGTLAYFILFYAQFKDHDYYFMPFLPFIILILINGIKTLQNIIIKPYFHIFIKLTLLIIVIVGVNYSKMKLNNNNAPRNFFKKEYWSQFSSIDKQQSSLVPDDYSRISFLIKENIEEIKKLEIKKDAKFVIAPDLCQNGGLFVLDRMGWNITHLEYLTVNKINSYKSSGAEYLLLATDEEKVIDIGRATGHLVFKGEGISIFNISR
jgi:hypothetical protein